MIFGNRYIRGIGWERSSRVGAGCGGALNQLGIIHGQTRAWSQTRMPTRIARARLCQKTARRIVPASGASLTPPVAVWATTMLWASIILPMTPPELLLAQVRMGEIPVCSAVTFWRFPKRTLDEVSLPVSATPSQPSRGEKNGNQEP